MGHLARMQSKPYLDGLLDYIWDNTAGLRYTISTSFVLQLTLKRWSLLAEPMFTVPPEPKVTAFTEQLTELKCVVEGFPTPKVEWRRQGNKELPFGRHYIRNNNLYLQNPIKEDEDIYMCHASTPAGSVMGGTEVTVETYGKISARIVYNYTDNVNCGDTKL